MNIKMKKKEEELGKKFFIVILRAIERKQLKSKTLILITEKEDNM